MDYETFIDRLEDKSDLWSREKVEAVAQTTLEVLGETLTTPERTWVSSRLPEPLDEAITRTWGGQQFDMHEFHDRISHREGLVLEYAGEQAQLVCRVLTDELDDEVLDYLREHLPDPFAALFEKQA